MMTTEQSDASRVCLWSMEGKSLTVIGRRPGRVVELLRVVIGGI